MSTGAGSARRLVAVALTDADLQGTGSDLRHVADAVTEVDVLVARQDPPGPLSGTSPMDAEDYPDDDLDGAGTGSAGAGPADAGDRGPVAVPGGGTPAGLRAHRLGLRQTVRDRDEPDLVAAMSELVGFDPDDRVFLLAPATGSDPVTDPEVAIVRRAVRRVARVYGLPVLQYRRTGPAAASPAPPIACGG